MEFFRVLAWGVKREEDMDDKARVLECKRSRFYFLMMNVTKLVGINHAREYMSFSIF